MFWKWSIFAAERRGTGQVLSGCRRQTVCIRKSRPQHQPGTGPAGPGRQEDPASGFSQTVDAGETNSMQPLMRTGIFVGSFDPFTIGHDAIVRRSLPLFDRIVIGVGINGRKQYMLDTAERTERIARLYAGNPKVEVKAYSDLTVDFARRERAGYIIKGVRSMKDFEYEREQADINRRLGGIETILLYADPQLESISSSMVRELKRFGQDITGFLPEGY